MPSTYSTSLKIELIANGEQSGTWGATTNNNLGTLIEQAITGVGSLALYGGDYTLTNYNGLPDESRNAVLSFTGTLSAPANVIAPSVQKTYIITNNAGANVTIKTATGNGVTVQNGLSSLVYCDGTNFYTAVNVNNVIGDLSVSGNETVGGILTIGGNITLANTVTAGNLAMTANSGIITMAGNTGAFLPPTGTSAQRPSSPAVGMSRWNTDLGVYEIWNGLNWQNIASGSYNVNYLIVAGGGAGGSSSGGGGGGLLTGGYSPTANNSYSVVVGAGGVGVSGNGSNSSAFGLVAIGGGGGGGRDGGSGGGGFPTPGNGTVGQGYGGGLGTGVYGGGGGGATQAGLNAVGGARGGDGGAGYTSTISGSAVTYAGGGFGSGNAGGTNGSGGAGSGNAGGGGGGYNPDPGKNGIVILSYIYPTQRATGGTVTSYTVGSDKYWVHTFTTSGTFTT